MCEKVKVMHRCGHAVQHPPAVCYPDAPLDAPATLLICSGTIKLYHAKSRRLCANCRKEKREEMRSQLKKPSDPDYSIRATLKWMKDWSSLEMDFQQERARTQNIAWTIINTAISAAQKEGSDAAVGLFDEETFRQVERECFIDVHNDIEGGSL